MNIPLFPSGRKRLPQTSRINIQTLLPASNAPKHGRNRRPTRGIPIPSSDEHDFLRDDVNPQNKAIPAPLSQWSSASAISVFLHAIVNSYGRADDIWSVYQRPLGFATGQARTNWQNFGDAKMLDVYSDWFLRDEAFRIREENGITINAEIHTRIAFFVTIGKGLHWVSMTNEDWQAEPWHAWLGILVENGKKGAGRMIIIFDTNTEHSFPDPEERPMLSALSKPQQDFVETVRKRGKVTSVWIGGCGNTIEGLCMRLTGEALLALVKSMENKQLARWTASSLQAEGRWRQVRIPGASNQKGQPVDTQPDAGEGPAPPLFLTMTEGLREETEQQKHDRRVLDAVEGEIVEEPDNSEDSDYSESDPKGKRPAKLTSEMAIRTTRSSRSRTPRPTKTPSAHETPTATETPRINQEDYATQQSETVEDGLTDLERRIIKQERRRSTQAAQIAAAEEYSTHTIDGDWEPDEEYFPGPGPIEAALTRGTTPPPGLVLPDGIELFASKDGQEPQLVGAEMPQPAEALPSEAVGAETPQPTVSPPAPEPEPRPAPEPVGAPKKKRRRNRRSSGSRKRRNSGSRRRYEGSRSPVRFTTRGGPTQD